MVMPNLSVQDVAERVRDLLPNVTDAHEFADACRWFAASLNHDVDYYGTPSAPVFGTETSAPVASVSGYFDSPLAVRSRRTELSASEIARRATFLSAPWITGDDGTPERNDDYRNRGNGTPDVTGAPDDYSGVRSTVRITRSAKGRAGSVVLKRGTPAIAGSVREDARPYSVPIGPPCHRTVSARFVPFHHATGATSSVVGELLARTIERTARRLSSGRFSGIDIGIITDHAYGPLGLPAMLGTDTEAFAEVTPEMYDCDAHGIAVHRADMSGQSGVLELTERITELATANHPARLRIARPNRYRKTDKTVRHGSVNPPMPVPFQWRTMVTPATIGATITELPAPTETTRPLPFIVASNGETVRAESWAYRGHHLVARPPRDMKRAKKNTGIRAKKTVIRTDNLPETPAGWTELANGLNRGERATGTDADGIRWTISRSAIAGIYSGRANGQSWSGRRTTTAVGNIMHRTLN